MNINLSVRHSINAAESVREIFGGGVKVRRRATVVGEVFADGREVGSVLFFLLSDHLLSYIPLSW